MTNLESLFRNIFEGKEISDAKLGKFAEEHMQRLKTNNVNGIFTDILAETEAAYNDYFGSTSSERSIGATQKASTLGTNNVIKEFKQFVRRFEGIVRAKYGMKSATYIKFYPNRNKDYNRASNKNIQMLMSQFADAAKIHQAELGPELYNKVTELKEAYLTARSEQLVTKGKLKSKKVDAASNRSRLELQLCKNLHTIAALYPGNIRKCMKFFDQSTIRRPRKSAHDGKGRAVGKITANGQPVVGAKVSYEGLAVRTTRSKPDGTYRAFTVPIGMHQITVSAPGYKLFTGKIIIQDAGDTVMDVDLAKN